MIDWFIGIRTSMLISIFTDNDDEPRQISFLPCPGKAVFWLNPRFLFMNVFRLLTIDGNLNYFHIFHSRSSSTMNSEIQSVERPSRRLTHQLEKSYVMLLKETKYIVFELWFMKLCLCLLNHLNLNFFHEWVLLIQSFQ